MFWCTTLVQNGWDSPYSSPGLGSSWILYKGMSSSFLTISYVVFFHQSTLLCLAWKPFPHSKMWSPGSSQVTSFCSHIGLVPAFPEPGCRANAVFPPVGLHSYGVLSGAVSPFVFQTGDQGLTLVSTQKLVWAEFRCIAFCAVVSMDQGGEEIPPVGFVFIL